MPSNRMSFRDDQIPWREREVMPGLPKAPTRELEEPWHLEFCRWLAAHPRAKVKVQEAKASQLAGTDIPWVELKRIRSTKNFRWQHATFRKLIDNRLEKSREVFETQNVEQALELHRWGMDRAKEAQDHRAVAALVDPAIKALYRDQPTEAQQRPMIVLNLGTYARANLDTPMDEVEYEVIAPEEPKRLESGDQS